MEPFEPITPSRWADAHDPSDLFIRFWRLAGEWEAADRAIMPRTTVSARHQLAAAVAIEDGKEAAMALLAVIEADWPPEGVADRWHVAGGLLIDAMRSIEDLYAHVHPRTRLCPPSLAPAPPVPAWLEAAEIRRLRFGSYFEADDFRLVPNGPFARHARGRYAASANKLQDHFPHLTVAPVRSSEEDRTITIEMKVIGTDAMRGVPAARSFGRETIRFIPLAEDKSDLAFSSHERAGRAMLDVTPNIDTAARLLEALVDGSGVDIAFAPELTVPGEAEERLRDGIAALAEQAPRLILAGSGLSAQHSSCGRAWNEARVFGRGGVLLWRHRKFWPFEMQQQSALSYGLADPGEGCTLVENIAGSSQVTVVDLDGFGRCLVLICQDIEAQPVVSRIIARYQPDWVLTPILDPGVKIPSWVHQRALALSRSAQSRLLIGSSLTLSMQAQVPGEEPAVGLALGPAEPSKQLDDSVVMKRAVALVKAAAGPSPRSALLVWNERAPIWTKSDVGAAPV